MPNRILIALFALLATPSSMTGPQFQTAGGMGSATSVVAGVESTGARSSGGMTGAMLLPSVAIDVRLYGAKCDGRADDAAAINKALAAAGAKPGSAVRLPAGAGCAIGSTVTVPAHVMLTGSGNSRSGGLIARSTNLTMVQLGGQYASVENLYINASAAGTNTAGYGIAENANPYMASVRDVSIDGAFVGLDINGNSGRYDHMVVNGTPVNGVGWQIGRRSTRGTTTDARITNSTSAAATSAAKANQIIYDAGGLYEEDDDLLGASFGTYIDPGADQWVIWSFFDNTVLGDTNGTVAFAIDTSAGSARVNGLMCSNCWAASAQNASIGTNMSINNSAGAAVDGIHFIGARVYNSARSLVFLNGGTNVTFDASQFCGAAAEQADIAINTGVSGISIRNSHVGGACDGQTHGGSVGIELNGSNAKLILVGNDFAGVATAVTGSPLDDSIAESNAGLGKTPIIAAAASIKLSGISKSYSLTGRAAITAISGGWPNRSVVLVPTGGGISFATGGNVCAAYSAAANVPVTATFIGGCWYLK